MLSSRTSHTAWRASRAGTARPSATTHSPSRSIRSWWSAYCDCSVAALLADERLATLLHDAPEYVIGDLISPFKAVIDLPYRRVEERLHVAIRLRFGLPAALPATLATRIKKADQAAAYLEATRLAGFSDAEAARFFGRPGGISADKVTDLIAPWPAKKAEQLFLKNFRAVAESMSTEPA